MVVTTRYQKNRSIYAEVLENPHLLDIITSFLKKKDLVSFISTNKKFYPGYSQIGVDVILPKIDKHYEKYIRAIEEQQKKETDREFISRLMVLFRKQEIRSNIRNTSRVFDHFLKYKDHIMSMKDTYGNLLDVMENRLVFFARTNEGGFAPDALNYLSSIFDVAIKAHAVPDGAPDEYVEYIVTTKGEHVYI
jgi:hypothetical protein